MIWSLWAARRGQRLKGDIILYRIVLALIFSLASLFAFANTPVATTTHEMTAIKNAALIQLPTPVPLKLATPQRTVPVTAATTKVPGATLDQLQTQLNATQEDLKIYKRQVFTQFSQVEQQNQTLQQEVSRLQQTLPQITQQMTLITEKLALNSGAALSASAMSIDQASQHFFNISPKEKLSTVIFAIAVILIAALWWPWSKASVVATGPSKRTEPTINEGLVYDEEEYDFMNSREAIPAKLDLARAYIDMADYSSAQRTLQEVINLGNPVERKQAKLMLSKIAA